MANAKWIAVPHGTGPRACRSCGQSVYWIVTTTGKRMPVDCTVADAQEPDAINDGRGVSHFATCPHAANWRKRI